MRRSNVWLVFRIIVVGALAVAAVFLYRQKAKEVTLAAETEEVAVSRYFDAQGVIVEGVLDGVSGVSISRYANNTEESHKYLQQIVRLGNYPREEFQGAEVYEIALLNAAGEAVIPEETVNCYISLPAELQNMKGNTYVVYRIMGDMGVEHAAFLKGNELVIRTKQNGTYVVAKLMQEPASEKPTAVEDEAGQLLAEIPVQPTVAAQPTVTATQAVPRESAGTEENRQAEAAASVQERPEEPAVPAQAEPEAAAAVSDPVQDPAGNPEAQAASFHTVAKVNLRAGMSTEEAVLTVLEPGTPLSVLQAAENSEWVMVSANGQIGYVNVQYVGAD
ncbi:MAG: SH3 domain-containing protein [Lachnospiraceae bacterium]|nr:SH3 domain-containing protein [Lachnospiraceae bacterium]